MYKRHFKPRQVIALTLLKLNPTWSLRKAMLTAGYTPDNVKHGKVFIKQYVIQRLLTEEPYFKEVKERFAKWVDQ